MDEKNNSEKKKRFISPSQIKFTKKISVKSLPKTSEEVSMEKEEALIKPIKIAEHETNLTDEIEVNKEFNFINELQQLIEKRGSTLNSGLCEKFISEILRSFEKPLKFEDLEYAAECFVRIEKNKDF
ncbi:MAG: hypothetical protein ACFE8A_09340 [Candidatus Hodarchaeota archaeon]